MSLPTDEAIESLQILKNSWEVSLRNSLNKTEREIDQNIVESLAEAIETMRKYQRIQQIIAMDDENHRRTIRLADLKEVLEDGN